LYDPKVRNEIGFGVEQQARLRALLEDRHAAFQTENLKLASAVWQLLTPEQRAKLPEVVKGQGPTSAALSLAFALDFDFHHATVSYPMLGVRPMREQLRMTPEQVAALQAVMEQRPAERRQDSDERTDPDADRAAIEAILTPEQLTMLNEANLRRQVVLALGYSEKRAAVGVTDEQLNAFQEFANQARQRLHALDRQLLPQAMQIVTPEQREQLAALIGWDAAP
jgi:Spy/CpxP family protein refolding chaperone